MKRISSYIGDHPTLPPVEQDLIHEKLPFEIFVRVLSHLDKRDISRSSLVSRLWSQASIDTAKRKEFAMIKGFTKLLAENLHGDAYAEQRKALLHIGSDTKILGSVNLMGVKHSMVEMKEKILNILKDLNDADINELSKTKANSRFFENIYVLAKIYKKLDEASEIPDAVLKAVFLENISQELMRMDQEDKAIEVANGIPLKFFRKEAFRSIAYTFLQRGCIDEAITCADRLSSERERSDLFHEISKALREKNLLDKAIEVLTLTTYTGERDRSFSEMSLECVAKNNTDKAVEIVVRIQDSTTKKLALGRILADSVLRSQTDKSIEVANLLLGL